jgi:hypothetical protein
MEGAVLDSRVVGGCAGWDEVVLLLLLLSLLFLGRASKSDMMMGRPTKSFMRMWVVAMVLIFLLGFDGG